MIKKLFLLAILAFDILNAKIDIAKANKYQGVVFTAIAIPDEIKTVLSEIQKELRSCLGAQFSPSARDNLHMTIQVIAPVKQGKDFERIDKALSSVAKPLKKHLKKKKWDRPWHFESKLTQGQIQISKKGVVKLKIPRSEILVNLGNVMQKELHGQRIVVKRNDVGNKYSAHITLGRVPVKDKKAQKAIAKCRINLKKKLAGKKFIVDKFVLLRSNRPAKDRKYAVLAEYPLGLGK